MQFQGDDAYTIGKIYNYKILTSDAYLEKYSFC